ncbi:MAG: hypothetical protein CSA53_00890 [Gammaproteobacteria bacterium]|nr:MAG: hypothetical protein CSA53_00890 [Gammaproteobacteria bacterium]
MTIELPFDVSEVKGFLHRREALALYDYAHSASALGAVLEIGSYCGKSTIYLGLACQKAGRSLFALDHHRGSEEHQPGQWFHDPALADGAGGMDTFGEFRRNIDRAGLSDTVIPIVASSKNASRDWATPLGMVFIDGGHSLDAALTDYRCWASHVLRGGILAIHDIFPDPTEGGQAPIAVLKLALASGLFTQIDQIETLAVLRRL